MSANSSSSKPSDLDSLVGVIVAGRYRLDRQLSSGATTAVFDALDTRTGQLVTFKLIRPRLAAFDEFKAGFDEAIGGAAELRHPNIATVYDWGYGEVASTSTAYIVSERLTGGSLRDMFDRGRRLTPSQALSVGLDACKALDHAHRREQIHGELTPAKIVFGDDRRLRIVDFGLSRLIGRLMWLDPSNVPTHVAWYAAPEQATGEPVSSKTDVYALAMVLSEAITGEVPFKADSTVSTLNARVGKLLPVTADMGPLAAVLEHGARPEASDRFSAVDFGKSLVQAASRLPRPEPLPLLSSGLFETPPEHLREAGDPTGGVRRSQPAEGRRRRAPQTPATAVPGPTTEQGRVLAGAADLESDVQRPSARAEGDGGPGRVGGPSRSERPRPEVSQNYTDESTGVDLAGIDMGPDIEEAIDEIDPADLATIGDIGDLDGVAADLDTGSAPGISADSTGLVPVVDPGSVELESTGQVPVTDGPLRYQADDVIDDVADDVVTGAVPVVRRDTAPDLGDVDEFGDADEFDDEFDDADEFDGAVDRVVSADDVVTGAVPVVRRDTAPDPGDVDEFDDADGFDDSDEFDDEFDDADDDDFDDADDAELDAELGGAEAGDLDRAGFERGDLFGDVVDDQLVVERGDLDSTGVIPIVGSDDPRSGSSSALIDDDRSDELVLGNAELVEVELDDEESAGGATPMAQDGLSDELITVESEFYDDDIDDDDRYDDELDVERPGSGWPLGDVTGAVPALSPEQSVDETVDADVDISEEVVVGDQVSDVYGDDMVSTVLFDDRVASTDATGVIPIVEVDPERSTESTDVDPGADDDADTVDVRVDLDEGVLTGSESAVLGRREDASDEDELIPDELVLEDELVLGDELVLEDELVLGDELTVGDEIVVEDEVVIFDEIELDDDLSDDLSGAIADRSVDDDVSDEAISGRGADATGVIPVVGQVASDQARPEAVAAEVGEDDLPEYGVTADDLIPDDLSVDALVTDETLDDLSAASDETDLSDELILSDVEFDADLFDGAVTGAVPIIEVDGPGELDLDDGLNLDDELVVTDVAIETTDIGDDAVTGAVPVIAFEADAELIQDWDGSDWDDDGWVDGSTDDQATGVVPIVDDAATGTIPVMSSAPPVSNASLSGQEPIDPEAHSGSRRFPWRAIIAAVIVIGLALVAFVAFQMLSTTRYVVPDLTGMPADEARAQIANNGWIVDESYERSDDVPTAGLVVRTTPVAGVEVAVGEPFELVISDGPIQRELPDLVGESSVDAQAALQKLGMTVTVERAYDEEVPLDTVIEWYSPDDDTIGPGSLVDPGTNIILVVSNGPSPREVPDLVGKSKKKATAALEEVQLTLAVDSEEFNDKIKAGAVISQSVAAGEKVARDSEISVVISRGPEVITFPDLSALTDYPSMKKALEDAGFKVELVLGSEEGSDITYRINGETPEPGQTFPLDTTVEFEVF